jgi:hypothetical protein
MKRTLLAVVAVLGLVLLPAAPGGAVPTVGAITSNFLRINFVAPQTPAVVPLPGSCAAPTLTFDITSVIGTAPNRVATGTARLSIPQGSFTYGGSYMMILNASGPLTLTEQPGNFAVSAPMAITAGGPNSLAIYLRVMACAPTTIPMCNTITSANLTLSGGYVGTVSSSVPISGSADVSLNGTLAAVSCLAPFGSIPGKTVYAPISAVF